MKNRLIICTSILCVIGFSILSCKKDDKKTKPEFSLEQPDQISDENYKIYSLVIEEKYSSEKIVIAQHSKSNVDLNYENQTYDYLMDSCQNFDTSLVQIHIDLNKSMVNFGEQFHSETHEIILISSAELSYIFDSQDINGNWEEFHNDYENSHGFIKFSRIAFNEDKTQAIFEIDSSYGSLGGDGSIVYLEKHEDVWTIIKVIMTWIS
jgi:hypothetical protein